MADQEFEKKQTEPGTAEPEETNRPEEAADPKKIGESGNTDVAESIVEPGDEPDAQQETVKPAVQESGQTGDYRQYNYNQQNGQYDYGNTGYHANYSQDTKPGEEGMDTRPLSMGEWALTLLALLIPCCGGIILYIFWAFSKKGNINRRNFCRAALIVLAGVAVIYFLVMSIIGGAVFSYVQHYGMY